MHLWRAGEVITAEKLSPRALSGEELMTFPTRVAAADGWPAYWRGERIVTFPTGFFTRPPMLALAARTAVPGIFLYASYTAKSANGFTLCTARVTQTETWVDWIAFEIPQY